MGEPIMLFLGFQLGRLSPSPFSFFFGFWSGGWWGAGGSAAAAAESTYATFPEKKNVTPRTSFFSFFLVFTGRPLGRPWFLGLVCVFHGSFLDLATLAGLLGGRLAPPLLLRHELQVLLLDSDSVHIDVLLSGLNAGVSEKRR